MTFKNTLGPNGTIVNMVSGKTSRELNPPLAESFMQLFDSSSKMLDLGFHFGAHWILNGGPQIDNLGGQKSKNIRKNEVQEAGWKKPDLLIDF